MILASNTLNLNCITRINLAWFNNKKELLKEIKKNKEIFVDIPINRKKPPKRNYKEKDLKEILKSKNIKYIGVSNCDFNLLKEYYEIYDKTIVPKIENKAGIKDIEKICKFLNKKYDGNRFLMIDQEDLYENLKSEKKMVKSLKKILLISEKYNCHPLIIKGVVFDKLTNHKIKLISSC